MCPLSQNLQILIKFFAPNSTAILPTFSTNFHFAQMGSHFTQNTTTYHCSLLSHHKPLSGICTYTKHPQPHAKTPLLWPDFDSGQNELLSGQKGPQLCKMSEKSVLTTSSLQTSKVGKTFLEVGKFVLFTGITAQIELGWRRCARRACARNQ